MHKCPHPDCEAMVPTQMFSCKRHWFDLPQTLRNRIWQEYRRKPGSPAHMEAMEAGVESLEARSKE